MIVSVFVVVDVVLIRVQNGLFEENVLLQNPMDFQKHLSLDEYDGDNHDGGGCAGDYFYHDHEIVYV